MPPPPHTHTMMMLPDMTRPANKSRSSSRTSFPGPIRSQENFRAASRPALSASESSLLPAPGTDERAEGRKGVVGPSPPSLSVVLGEIVAPSVRVRPRPSVSTNISADRCLSRKSGGAPLARSPARLPLPSLLPTCLPCPAVASLYTEAPLFIVPAGAAVFWPREITPRSADRCSSARMS